MAGRFNYEVYNRRKAFMDYIIENIDDAEYLNLRCSLVCPRLGIDTQTVRRYLEHFAKEGLLEYTHLQKGVWLVHYNGKMQQSSENAVYIPVKKPLRVCPKCKVEATNEGAKFCWKCGASLLSEKERLRDEFRNTLGSLHRFIDNAKDREKIMDVMTRVDKFAFGEEKGE